MCVCVCVREVVCVEICTEDIYGITDEISRHFLGFTISLTSTNAESGPTSVCTVCTVGEPTIESL